MPIQPSAPRVSPCPYCGRTPTGVTLIGSDPPVTTDTHSSRRDHYHCRCEPCGIGYRVGTVSALPVGPLPPPLPPVPRARQSQTPRR